MRYVKIASLFTMLCICPATAEQSPITGLFMKKGEDCTAYLDVTKVARTEALNAARLAAYDFLKSDDIGGCNKSDRFVFFLVTYGSYDEYARPKFGSMEIILKFSLSGSAEKVVGVPSTPEYLLQIFPVMN